MHERGLNTKIHDSKIDYYKKKLRGFQTTFLKVRKNKTKNRIKLMTSFFQLELS